MSTINKNYRHFNLIKEELMEIEEMEEEIEDLQEVEPFLIDEKADEKNCFICSRYRVNGKICGTFKYTNDHFIKNGRDNIENWFSCELYTAK